MNALKFSMTVVLQAFAGIVYVAAFVAISMFLATILTGNG